MVGFASGAITGDFRVNPRSASLSVLVLFKHEHPGTFGKNEPIAIRRKWTRRTLRLVIPRLRKSANHGVALHNSFRNRRIDAARDKHGLDASLNMLVGVTERVGR